MLLLTRMCAPAWLEGNGMALQPHLVGRHAPAQTAPCPWALVTSEKLFTPLHPELPMMDQISESASAWHLFYASPCLHYLQEASGQP